ncbi:twitching motility protein PilT, partial [Coprococcus eutactus]|nr:twitching motility protein PilT [Coprococcus eutactus]
TKMIHNITGDKGKGKTKALIHKVNNDVKVVSGSVVFLDNNNKHMYELSNRGKMINCTNYGISKLDAFT